MYYIIDKYRFTVEENNKYYILNGDNKYYLEVINDLNCNNHNNDSNYNTSYGVWDNCSDYIDRIFSAERDFKC